MQLFGKNDVQVDHPYHIEHSKKEAPTLACPRCGHVQARKKNVVCAGCNRMVPTENCRQTWNNLPANEFREKAKEYFGNEQESGKDFKKAKRTYSGQKTIRRVILSVFFAVLLVVPSIFAIKMYMGDEAWSDVEHKLELFLLELEGMNPPAGISQ